MTVATRTDILDILSSIPESEGGRDIVSAGFVSAVSVEEGRARVILDAGDPEKAAMLEPLRARVEAAVRQAPGLIGASVVLTAERKAAPAPAAEKPLAGHGDGAKNILHVIAVASGKGGVGKSTTAVNLALALSERGLAVGILDVDIYGPSLPRMLGLSGPPDSLDGRMLPLQRFGLKAMSIGFLVPENEPVIWRGPMVMSALRQMLNDVAWGALDVLVLDMPPGTGDAPLTAAQSAHLAGAVIVSTPQDIALLDARRALAMFRKLKVPTLGIIENMNQFICPSCGHESHIFGHGGAREEAERQGCPFLGEIPLHPDIRIGGDAGNPAMIAAPEGPHAAAYRRIATTVAEALAQQTP